MIYLDNSATTKPCKEAVEAMTSALTEGWANPSALYGFGFDAAKQLRSARHSVASVMGAEPDRIFFTSGGTEADNWAIFGTVKRFGKRGKHIITTAIEHPAVLQPARALEAAGFRITRAEESSRIYAVCTEEGLRSLQGGEYGWYFTLVPREALEHDI